MNDKPFLLQLDLSQVESRIVYILTRDPKLVSEAQSKPWDFDMHTENARLVFGQLSEDKEKFAEQRFLGKKAVHGAQRAMSGKRLSDELLKMGIIRTVNECDEMIWKYHQGKPAVRGVYFKECRDELFNTRCMTNSWGRTIRWTYHRNDENLHREVYSWRPQSEAADLMNQWGLVPAYNYIKANGLRSRLQCQIHDSLTFNTFIDEAYDLAVYVSNLLQRPRQYPAGPLAVPVTTAIGLSLKMSVEWKKFPERDEFNTKVKELF